MKMLWLRLKRWYHWYNSGRRILITEGGTVYYLVGTPAPGAVRWVDIGYVDDGFHMIDGADSISWYKGEHASIAFREFAAEYRVPDDDAE